MGAYDTFGSQGAQLKCGNCEYIHYNVGDKVPIDDGAYLDYGGLVVVIDKGHLVAVVDSLSDKWGGPIDSDEILNTTSEVVAAIEAEQGVERGPRLPSVRERE